MLHCRFAILHVLPPNKVLRPDDCSNRRLHCEDGAESGLALRDAFIGFGGIRQWITLDDCFDLSLRHEIKGFVEIFGTVLLTTNDADTLRDEIHQRNGKWLRVRAHSDQPTVWP